MNKPSWHLFPSPGLATCPPSLSYIWWKCMSRGEVYTYGRQGVAIGLTSWKDVSLLWQFDRVGMSHVNSLMYTLGMFVAFPLIYPFWVKVGALEINTKTHPPITLMWSILHSIRLFSFALFIVLSTSLCYITLPMFVPPALQQLLDPVFLADRQLFALDDSLRTLIDMTDTLEDLDVPAAVRQLQQTINALEHTIFHVKICKLHHFVRLHCAIQRTWRQWHTAPPVELEVDPPLAWVSLSELSSIFTADMSQMRPSGPFTSCQCDNSLCP